MPKQLLQNKNLMKKHSKNIVIEAHEVTPDLFPGLTCASYRGEDGLPAAYTDDSLLCTQQQNFSSSALAREGKVNRDESSHNIIGIIKGL